MNVSLLYGKKTESTDGKSGYVISVNASNGKIVCFTCADENEKEFTIDVKNIVKIGDKIIYEDREHTLKNAKPVRLGRAGFDEYGNFLGCVEDFTFSGQKLLKVKIGRKSHLAEELVYGDVVIVKNRKKIKSDVLKNGKVIIKKGTPLTESVLKTAKEEGEYIQTNLKSL